MVPEAFLLERLSTIGHTHLCVIFSRCWPDEERRRSQRRAGLHRRVVWHSCPRSLAGGGDFCTWLFRNKLSQFRSCHGLMLKDVANEKFYDANFTHCVGLSSPTLDVVELGLWGVKEAPTWECGWGVESVSLLMVSDHSLNFRPLDQVAGNNVTKRHVFRRRAHHHKLVTKLLAVDCAALREEIYVQVMAPHMHHIHIGRRFHNFRCHWTMAFAVAKRLNCYFGQLHTSHLRPVSTSDRSNIHPESLNGRGAVKRFNISPKLPREEYFAAGNPALQLIGDSTEQMDQEVTANAVRGGISWKWNFSRASEKCDVTLNGFCNATSSCSLNDSALWICQFTKYYNGHKPLEDSVIGHRKSGKESLEPIRVKRGSSGGINMARGKGRSLRKRADQWNRPARVPHTKIRKRPLRGMKSFLPRCGAGSVTNTPRWPRDKLVTINSTLSLCNQALARRELYDHSVLPTTVYSVFNNLAMPRTGDASLSPRRNVKAWKRDFAPSSSGMIHTDEVLEAAPPGNRARIA
ncbi:hypothetical protein PR048_023787 [Dryococelus australis]|uniref:Uncharacterized protein n=1 Tax=Dryococelus australis TaxID=614101 RepID=A0ABQ9GV22_9NEOP|nr:hypothetical protein PR048_023787 [Dryococelus australis]